MMAQVLTREINKLQYPPREHELLPTMERPSVPHQTCLSLLPGFSGNQLCLNVSHMFHLHFFVPMGTYRAYLSPTAWPDLSPPSQYSLSGAAFTHATTINFLHPNCLHSPLLLSSLLLILHRNTFRSLSPLTII